MKKQFLFLFLALFASVTVAFGQGAVHHTAPNPLTCGTADALHPIAGKPYDYGVGVSPTGGQYEWWATKATTFIQNGTVTHTTMLTAPGQLTAVGAGYGTPGATQTMSITWSSAILANTVFNTNPTFVAVGYSGATGSCADNLKVYQIDPRNGFTVDIFNIETATGNTLTTGTTSDCVSNIQSTTWNGTQMVYDYGTTTLTYEVVAANFTDFFTPAFRIAGLDAAEAATISWAYDQAFTNVGLTPTAITNGTVVTSTVTAAVGGTVTDTSNGVSIFVRVVVNHQAKEHTTAATIDLAVNAQNSVSQADVVNTDCTQTQYMEDVATRSLNPRPALTSMPVAPGFVPANTVP